MAYNLYWPILVKKTGPALSCLPCQEIALRKARSAVSCASALRFFEFQYLKNLGPQTSSSIPLPRGPSASDNVDKRMRAVFEDN